MEGADILRLPAVGVNIAENVDLVLDGVQVLGGGGSYDLVWVFHKMITGCSEEHPGYQFRFGRYSLEP